MELLAYTKCASECLIEGATEQMLHLFRRRVCVNIPFECVGAECLHQLLERHSMIAFHFVARAQPTRHDFNPDFIRETSEIIIRLGQTQWIHDRWRNKLGQLTISRFQLSRMEWNTLLNGRLLGTRLRLFETRCRRGR